MVVELGSEMEPRCPMGKAELSSGLGIMWTIGVVVFLSGCHTSFVPEVSFVPLPLFFLLCLVVPFFLWVYCSHPLSSRCHLTRSPDSEHSLGKKVYNS